MNPHIKPLALMCVSDLWLGYADVSECGCLKTSLSQITCVAYCSVNVTYLRGWACPAPACPSGCHLNFHGLVLFLSLFLLGVRGRCACCLFL
jgi:hypothetical protein